MYNSIFFTYTDSGDNMKINIKKLLVCILIPVLLGTAVGLLTSTGNFYEEFEMPSFTPPGFIFPIVWFILYTLMGISSYIVLESNSYLKDESIIIYATQLVVNLVWSFLFFTFNWFLFSFLWILLLIALVVIMIIKFSKISKTSAYLQIPYLLWLVFAAILNFSVYLLNR